MIARASGLVFGVTLAAISLGACSAPPAEETDGGTSGGGGSTTGGTGSGVGGASGGGVGGSTGGGTGGASGGGAGGATGGGSGGASGGGVGGSTGGGTGGASGGGAGGDPDAGVDAGASLGAACGDGGACASGFCVDGVCCDSACGGFCETCSPAGLCAPVGVGLDPDLECPSVAFLPGDAGTPDAGLSLSTCAGRCNGNRACEFPGAERSCTAPVCASSTTSVAFECNGAGSCVAAPRSCVAAVCSGGSCPTTCSSSSACLPGYFCENAACTLRKPQGQPCTLSEQCVTGICSQGVCCDRVCAAPEDCTSIPDAGLCSCAGSSCATCNSAYRDVDNDTYGDDFATFDAGIVGVCGLSTPPVGYRLTGGDCDDADPRVHPGQTTYFPDASVGRQTFDYDCNGTLEPRWRAFDAGTACRTCAGPATACAASPQCSGTTVGLACGLRFSCAGTICFFTCGAVLPEGFVGAPTSCGEVASLVTCQTCQGDGGVSSTQTPRPQECR